MCACEGGEGWGWGRLVRGVERKWWVGRGGCVCVAELLGVAALLSVAAPLSLYNLSQPYSGFYCGRWFCSVLHRFASLCCLSAHIYLSEKA